MPTQQQQQAGRRPACNDDSVSDIAYQLIIVLYRNLRSLQFSTLFITPLWSTAALARRWCGWLLGERLLIESAELTVGFVEAWLALAARLPIVGRVVRLAGFVFSAATPPSPHLSTTSAEDPDEPAWLREASVVLPPSPATPKTKRRSFAAPPPPITPPPATEPSVPADIQMTANEAMVSEAGVRLLVTAKLNEKPGSASGFYNPKMALRRSLCSHTLHAALAPGAWDGRAGEGLGGAGQAVRVVDGFSASGVIAIRWLHELAERRGASQLRAPQEVEITAVDFDEACCAMIARNASLNVIPSQPHDTAATAASASSRGTLRIACMDFRALLLLSPPFDFVHVDPFGSCVPYLDVLASRAAHGSVVSITATDTASLFANYPEVARRVYGVHANRKDPNWREVGARILGSALADACARHGRGIEVLHTHSPPSTHFVHMTARIRKGAAAADATRALIVGAVTPDGNEVGPLWLGPLQSEAFLTRCLASCSAGGGGNGIDHCIGSGSGSGSGISKGGGGGSGNGSGGKAPRADSLHRETQKAFALAMADAPGLPPFSMHVGSRSPAELVAMLRTRGYGASRSAFDPQRVRTEAPPSEWQEIEGVTKSKPRPRALSSSIPPPPSPPEPSPSTPAPVGG